MGNPKKSEVKTLTGVVPIYHINKDDLTNSQKEFIESFIKLIDAEIDDGILTEKERQYYYNDALAVTDAIVNMIKTVYEPTRKNNCF